MSMTSASPRAPIARRPPIPSPSTTLRPLIQATFTKHIFANGEDAADVQRSTTTAKVYYIHDDALGATNVISNASGTVAEVLDYYGQYQ